MASEGASGADRSDSDKSSDNSSKADRAEREMSDKSREALSPDRPQSSREPSVADRAASQERMQATGEAAKGRMDPGPANKDGPPTGTNLELEVTPLETRPVQAQQVLDPAAAAALSPPPLTLVPNARLQTLTQAAPAAQPAVNLGTLAKLGRVTGVALAVDLFFSTNHPTAQHTYLGANARVEHGLATMPQLQTLQNGAWQPADVAFEMRENGIAVDLAALEAASGLTAPEVLGPGIESLPIMDDPGSLHTGHPPAPPVGEDVVSTPAEDLYLPNDTGDAPPVIETEPLVTLPPEEVGPDVVTMARPGEPTPVRPQDDEATRRSIQRENESAQILSGQGIDVLQNPVVAGPKNPDYLIEGEVYDHYAPETSNVRNIWSEVRGKVESGQTNNVVIGLQDSDVDEQALRQQFEDWPIEGLENVIIVRADGTIGRF